MHPYARILPLALVVIFVILTVTTHLISEDNIPEEEKDYIETWDYEKFATNFECMESNWCDTYYNDSAAAQEYLYKLQHPADCSTARFLVLPYEYYSGMGSSIRIRAQYMANAVQENRIYILPDGAEWTYSRVCNPPTYECYFEPITNCSVSLHAPDWEKAPVLMNYGEHYNVRVVRLANEYIINATTGFSRTRYVPSQFAHKDYFWWHAQVAVYHTRPNARTREIVEKLWKEVFPPDGRIPHPIISMYVRHGDKWKEANLKPFSAYMAIVKNLSTIYGVKHIYLGTDNPEVIDDLINYPEYNFYYIESKRYNGGPLDIVHINNGADLMRVSLGDLYTQVQGDIFIGTRTSNWCRLIDELRKVAGKARIPYYTPENYEEFLSQE